MIRRAAAAALVGLALAACGAPAPPPSPPPSAPRPAAPAPAPLPAPSSPDPRIPREALAYRSTLIRAWRFYFAMAESPAVGFGQVHQESRWKAEARSPVGASGLAQFMPATAQWINGVLPAEVRAACPSSSGCPTDPGWALNAMAKFDYVLHKGITWAATPDDRWGAALAGYNAGSGWVSRERAACGSRAGCDPSRWFGHVDGVCLRTPAACRETREYSDLILHRWRPLYAAWLAL